MAHTDKEQRKAYAKKHYEENKEIYKTRAAKKRKEQIAQNRQYIQEYKQAHFCLDCNAQYPREPWLMEFDHVRGEKKFNIGDSKCHSTKMLLAEIDKCDLLCLICHRRRTAKRNKWNPSHSS